MDSVYYRGINLNRLHVWIKLDNPDSLWGLRALRGFRSAYQNSARVAIHHRQASTPGVRIRTDSRTNQGKQNYERPISSEVSMEKTCSHCHKPFESTQFKTCDECRKCARDQGCVWREKNHERWLEIAKKYRDTHSEQVRTKNKKCYEKNKEARNEYCRNRYLHNKAEYAASRNEWRKQHPEEFKVQKHNYRARRRGAAGTFTTDELREIAHQQDNRCYYCHKLFFNGTLERDQHIEHKIPIIRGGSNDISNIVLSCSSCNIKKNRKTDREFLLELVQWWR